MYPKSRYHGNISLPLLLEGLLDTLPRVRESKEESSFAALDLKSDDNEYVLQVEIPGMDKDDIKMFVENGHLCVSGEKKEEKSDKRNHIQERRYGAFERHLELPDDAVPDLIRATCKNGVLTVTIPRQKAEKNKKFIDIA